MQGHGIVLFYLSDQVSLMALCWDSSDTYCSCHLLVDWRKPHTSVKKFLKVSIRKWYKNPYGKKKEGPDWELSCFPFFAGIIDSYILKFKEVD